MDACMFWKVHFCASVHFICLIAASSVLAAFSAAHILRWKLQCVTSSSCNSLSLQKASSSLALHSALVYWWFWILGLSYSCAPIHINAWFFCWSSRIKILRFLIHSFLMSMPLVDVLLSIASSSRSCICWCTAVMVPFVFCLQTQHAVMIVK